MHNFVKILISLLILPALAACGTKASIKYTDKSFSTKTTEVKAKIPRFSHIGSDSLEQEINNEFIDVCTNMLAEFKDAANTTNEFSVFEINTAEHYNRNGLLSVTAQIEYSANKTSASLRRITKNIDIKQGTELSLANLFSDSGYIDMLNERINEHISAHSEQYTDLWEKPKVGTGQKFYITSENLVLYYSPYELSYYERGFVEIPIPLSDMSGYLKSEYRFLSE